MKIEATYVLFEQAKLLKVKMYDISVELGKYGSAENENHIYHVNPEFTGWKGRMREAYFESPIALLKPQQWQVIEWLRVVHGIWIEINYMDEILQFNWKTTIIKTNAEERGNWKYNTPQEAYSAAFDYTLNKLI